MKCCEVFLLCFLAYQFFLLLERKREKSTTDYLKGHLDKIKPNTSKNSTFSLAPSVLQIMHNRDKQVLAPVTFEVCINDSLGFQNYHLELNPYLETNT